MLNFRRSSVLRFVFISGLFIIVLFVLLNFNRLPRILDKITQVINVSLRTIKFKLSPTIVVGIGNSASTKSLEVIRHSMATGPLRVNPANPRYFTDHSGRAIYVTGAHTWANLQDHGLTDPPPVFEYGKYLDFLVGYNHNFFRLWAWEQANLSTQTTGDYFFNPLPYQRVGKENALEASQDLI